MSSRVYYRMELQAKSALSIGGSDSVLTDVDVVLDSRGLPVIPAASLCGAMRAYASYHMDSSTVARIFGGKVPHVSEGVLRMYDATHVEGTNQAVSIRDSVSLQERVAAKKLKFDREIVDAGARFCAVLEVLNDITCPQSAVVTLAAAIDNGSIMLGSKKTRGMGRTKVVGLQHASFDLDKAADRTAWLNFDPFDKSQWEGKTSLLDNIHTCVLRNDAVRISLGLELVGGVSVREYTTEPESYDQSQLVVHVATDDEGTELLEGNRPIIPGTSWAGAIRDAYREFAGADYERVDKLFGTVRGDDPHAALVSFGESELAGGEWKVFTRTAIDRFTGGALHRALYTTRAYFGGTTNLVIRIRNVASLENADLVPLVATLADLHNGLVMVGGQASVGYGRFRIDRERTTLMGPSGDKSEAFIESLMKQVSGTDLIQPNCAAVAKAIQESASNEGDVR